MAEKSDRASKTVAYIFPTSHRFRVPFHEALRAQLSASGIVYDYIYSRVQDKKGDLSAPQWARSVGGLNVLGARAFYQQAVWTSLSYDLVILQQENGLLSNYPIIVLRKLLGRRVAYFGHGRNFQSRKPHGAGERFKRFWIDKVDWWFAYTAKSAEIVAGAGFPSERITVFNNAIDTTSIRSELASLNANSQQELRERLFGGTYNVGVYVGGLYDEKRLPFLLNAARIVRCLVPDFHLLIIGGGPGAPAVKRAADRESWIHYVGPKFGHEKTSLVSLARVFLMPGAAGLAVLDSFAYGTPMVTTALPYHGPEIAYVEHGSNGIVVRDVDSPTDFAEAVARVLTDDDLRQRLVAGGQGALSRYTVEGMVERFSQGILHALNAPPLH